MALSAQIIDFKGADVIQLTAGKYRALIAPFLGSNVMRLQDTTADIDVFRYNDDLTIDERKAAPVTYGLPTLYLPNRLSSGVLKVSDATYKFPLNDPLGNYIHGFLHTREHSIVSVEVASNTAIAKTMYIYDDKDEMFSTFPVSFKAEFTFTLSEAGLDYSFTMTNTSDKQLPYGVCNHTAFNGPFVNGGNGLDVRLYLPIGEKWELDSTCIPTGEFLPMTNHERQYITGSQVPVLHDIDNDVFFAEYGEYENKQFRGAIISDEKTGHSIIYKVCDEFKFWVVWNDKGDKGYFCPEPSTWIIDAPNLPIPDSETGYAELAPGESRTLTESITVL